MIKTIGNHMHFPPEYSTDEILKTQGILCGALWYLDGRMKTIVDRQNHEQQRLTARLPERLFHFQA